MTKPIVLFDVDRTLFQTERWYSEHKKEVSTFFKKHISDYDENELCALYISLLKGGSRKSRLNLYGHLLDFAKLRDCDFEQLWEGVYEIYLQCDYSKFVHPEIKALFQNLDLDCRIGLYSEGERWFQTLKTTGQRLFDYFQEELIYVFRDKLAYLDKLPKNCTIIDDSDHIVEEVRNARPDINIIPVERNTGILRLTVDQILSEK